MQSSQKSLNTARKSIIITLKKVSISKHTNQKTSLNEIIYVACNIFHWKLVKNIKINIEAPEKYPLHCDQNLLIQCFSNLILNVLSYAFLGRDEERNIDILLSKTIKNEEAFYQVVFKDNSIGISKDNIDKIFDPFHTSNRQIGAGLGLSIVYNAMKFSLHGDISVQSQLGEGTRFTLDIPIKGR